MSVLSFQRATWRSPHRWTHPRPWLWHLAGWQVAGLSSGQIPRAALDTWQMIRPAEDRSAGHSRIAPAPISRVLDRVAHMESIDIAYDFRTDARGKDPDAHSPTLRRYHRILWRKPLPGGQMLTLSESTPGVYLHHRSELGEFFLSSDSVVQTFIRWPRLFPITRQLSDEELRSFFDLGYTIGGTMVFPSNQIDRKWTINQGFRLNCPVR